MCNYCQRDLTTKIKSSVTDKTTLKQIKHKPQRRWLVGEDTPPLTVAMADDLEFDYDIGGGQRKAAEENIEQEEEEEEEGDAGANDESALRAALHFHVGEICSAESEGKAMTGGAVSTLAEVCVDICILFVNVEESWLVLRRTCLKNLMW